MSDFMWRRFSADVTEHLASRAGAPPTDPVVGLRSILDLVTAALERISAADDLVDAARVAVANTDDDALGHLAAALERLDANPVRTLRATVSWIFPPQDAGQD